MITNTFWPILVVVDVTLAIIIFVLYLIESHEKERLARDLADAASELKVYKRLYAETQADLDGSNFKIFVSAYAPSESDAIHYKSEKAMVKNIRGRLAHNIADDILREFGDPTLTPEGTYSYKIKAKRV